jgi:formylglycine-generating enzyme required for sulfatase activity
MKECPTCRRCYADHLNHCPKDGGALAFSIIGDTVLDGRYQLEFRIGQGGMGAVYKAHHIFIKTQHAIKIILPDLVGNDPSLVTRFRQEAMAAAAIHHPNIIAVTDFGVVRGTTPFLVMEFVKGRSLHDIISAEGRLSPARAYEILAPVCAGLEAAHRQGIVHRDLKPLNILIKDDVPMNEGVKILDFGLAKIKSGELLGSFIAAQTTGMMGSPLYMSPEQWSDEEPDARADIYSLGVILYQMLTGEVPFKGTSIPSIMNKHLTQAPARLAALGVNVPPAIETVVRRALEKEPAKRPQSAKEFVKEFYDALAASADGATMVNIAVPEAEPITVVDTNPAVSFGAATGEEAAATNYEAREGNVAVTSDDIFVGTDGAKTQVGGAAAYTKDLRGEPRPKSTARETAANLSAKAASFDNATRAMTADSLASQTKDASAFETQVSISSMPLAPTASPSRKWMSVSIGAVLCVALVSFAVVGLYLRSHTTSTALTNSATNSNSTGVPTQKIKPDLVSIPGGTFKMGRDDLASQNSAAALVQTPAHEVSVKSFAMDRTEVTNAEYAQFVQETGHAPPTDWNGNAPPPGREKYPVANVDYNDAVAFAEWRSKRDGATYRLPTEEEWEYAARGGSKDFLYPWGNQWLDGFANVGTGDETKDAPKPVGSFAQGASPFGVLDMIGNVWEWTSSHASVYPGNNRIKLQEQATWMVRRGGGYTYVGNRQSAEIPATYRDFVPPGTKVSTLGFRLVRDGG